MLLRLYRGWLPLMMISVLFCLIWVSHRAVADIDSGQHQENRDRLPERVNRALLILSRDIQQAEGLIDYDSDRLVLSLENNRVRAYSFAYGVLWCNNYPVLTGLSTFNFECRSQSGHLLSAKQSDISVNRLGYTFGLENEGQPVFTSNSFNVSNLKIPDSDFVLASMQ